MAFTGLEQSLVGGVSESACAIDENAPFANVSSSDEELTEQEAKTISSIRILGNGCRLCHELYRETLQAVSMLGIPCDVEHCTDPSVLKTYSLKRNPALVVNDTPLCAGLRLKSQAIGAVITAYVKHGKTVMS